MTLRKGGSALWVFLCLAIVAVNSKYLERELSWDSKHLIISKESLKGTTLLYGACDFSDGLKSNGSCRVLLETFKFDAASDSVFCDVALKSPVSGDVNIGLVGKATAVLVALDGSSENSEKQRVQLMVVDLNTCRTSYAQFAAPPSKSKWTSDGLFVAPYESTYDVCFIHTDGAKTHEASWKGTYDLGGNVVKEIAPWAELESAAILAELTSAKYQSPDGGFVYARSDEEKYVVAFIDDKGKKILKDLDLPKNSFSAALFFDNNETASACLFLLDSHNIKCLVVGPQGSIKNEITLDVVPYFFTAIDGGYVVLYDKSIDSNKTPEEMKLPGENSQVYLRRLDAQGQLVKEQPLKLSAGHTDHFHYGAQVFKNDAGEYCVSYISFRNGLTQSPEYPNKLKVVAECLTDF